MSSAHALGRAPGHATAPATLAASNSQIPNFTPEQNRAADYLEQDACVVAGPGSGKTTVLVERYRRLVFDRNFEPRNILAITFTEKAAANMKAKLAAQFANDPPRLRELESAWVMTIHGFCARLLKENAIAAGVDPRFTVLSPRESDNLQWECLNTALDELTETRREQALELIEALQSPFLTADLKDVYDAIRSAGMTIAEVRDMPNPSSAEPVNITGELRGILSKWPPLLSAVQREEKLRLLEWCDEYDARVGQVGNLRPIGGALWARPDFVTFLELKTRLKINLNRVPAPFKDELRDFRELKHETAAVIDGHAAPFRAMIFDVLARFDELYRNRKSALGRVDFNDLERHAIALLKSNSEVRQKIQKQFRQVMLDEFQDINGQQAELIGFLRSPNVFFGVGDRNQSIYGFRHARPEIFTNYHEEVAFRAGQTVALLHNFRSRSAILSCVSDVLRNQDGIEERVLISGRNFAGKEEPSIEIMAIQSAAPIGDEEEEGKDAASDREAAWIAHRVNELRGTLYLGEPGETRAAGYRDFAVLCRNSDSMPAILDAFDRTGIPYVCGRRQSFLLSREGLDITALLSTISNPRDSISLATLLRSPFVGVSDEGLLRLRLLAGSLTGGLNKFAHEPLPHTAEPEIPDPDYSRLTRFCANLERWRSDLGLVPLDILLARALNDCGVDWTPVSTTGINIEAFLQLARTTGASMDLPSFLREIEDLSTAAGAESDLSDEDQGNSVQVMTAHAAKGLEFPVTIIAGMEKGTRRESRPVTFTPEYGLGVKWRNPLAKDGKDNLKDSWAEENKRTLAEREAREENRLLYVAMTRAEEHLILSWSRGKSKPGAWAGIIDRHFNLSQHPAVRQPEGYAVSILVTDADPPAQIHARGGSQQNEVERIARPAIEDQYETTVTVTSLAVFGACPRKYFIQRSLGWNTGRFRRFDPDEIDATSEDDDETNLSASRTGSAVHQILAGQTPEDDVPEARKLAGVFTTSDLGQRSAAATRAAREWAFIADIEGTIVRGSIDLWFEENGQLHIVDYKTDEVSAESAHTKAQEYAPQTALYAIALECALGKRPKSAYLHFLRPNIVVEITLDDPAIASARKLVADLRESQNELRFDMNEGDHCRTCQFYRSLCPAILDVAREPDHNIAGP